MRRSGVERHSPCTRPRRSPEQELWITPMTVTASPRQQRAHGRRPAHAPTDWSQGSVASRPAPQARSAEERKRRGSSPCHSARDGVGRSRRWRHGDGQDVSAPRAAARSVGSFGDAVVCRLSVRQHPRRGTAHQPVSVGVDGLRGVLVCPRYQRGPKGVSIVLGHNAPGPSWAGSFFCRPN